MLSRLFFSTSLLLLSTGVFADEQFDQCRRDIDTKALEAGVNSATIHLALDDLQPLNRVIKADRSQPEFVTTFQDYYQRRITDWRVQKGREKLLEYHDFLDSLVHQYGVPAQYLVAFWGLETNYGSYKGKIPTFQSLLTLACDTRRKSFFTTQLITALKLVEREHLEPNKLVGSWAGAVGHTQFMPTTYFDYAVDGDGDGVINLWDSEKDALASAANYLSKMGWHKNERWGREVIVPSSYNYHYAGLSDQKPLSYWGQQGFTTASGAPLAKLPMTASLIAPVGAAGPKFIVYENFDVIMRWNRSVSYALSVGRLADRINGGVKLTTPFPPPFKLYRADYQALQNALNARGYDAGVADGVVGSKTQSAIRGFQKDQGMTADGYPSADVYKNLGIKLERPEA